MVAQGKKAMVSWSEFSALLARYAKTGRVSAGDILFGAGIDISSIAFTEFVMELEEMTGTEIDLDSLDASIKTAGQLFQRLSGKVAG